jgi:hypothetical protein
LHEHLLLVKQQETQPQLDSQRFLIALLPPSAIHETAKYAIILEIRKAESFGEGGWISFDYVVMTDKNTLTYISESCVEKIYSILK